MDIYEEDLKLFRHLLIPPLYQIDTLIAHLISLYPVLTSYQA